ncbi:MAG: hypothetical protein KIH62_001015 [Candidatus Kerfeldbacteria bacterium]|nr:hypothetical protein [Candidatus Kerfeldbacteria bacterium]
MALSSHQLTPEIIAALDTQNMRGSIAVFEQQVMDAWTEASKVNVPKAEGITHIACFAMGGSALGMDVVRAACADQLKVPVTIINDYTIPASVNAHTFVVLSSYSGTTEETLAAAEKILNITQHVVVITTGATLASWAQQHNVPAYVYTPRFNPSNQPRMAIGYSIGSIAGVLSTAGLLQLTSTHMEEVVAGIRYAQSVCTDLNEHNPALMLAEQCAERIPVLFSSEHLEGIVHAVTNQINENGKLFAVRFPLPEANHHLTEALVAPHTLPQLATFIGINSTLYHPRNQVRYALTEQLLTSRGFRAITYTTHSTTKFGQLGEALTLGGWISFYLAMLGQIDPSPIPNVDWFKAQLKNA